MSVGWKFDDIDWSLFDPARVNSTMLRSLKAASVVEHNASDYGVYLKNVFAGDSLLLKEFDAWVQDEIKHGKVLAAWIKLADPAYNFDERFKAYVERFPIPVEATQSIRGSRASELLARCMVETGTSSYYTSLKDAADEPLLKQISAKIAADELRHYKLFYTHFKRYQKIETLNLYQRLRIALGRWLEGDGDELATAYYVANEETAPYNRKQYAKLYGKVTYCYYTRDHAKTAMAMFCKAIGISPHGMFHKILSMVAFKMLSAKGAG